MAYVQTSFSTQYVPFVGKSLGWVQALPQPRGQDMARNFAEVLPVDLQEHPIQTGQVYPSGRAR